MVKRLDDLTAKLVATGVPPSKWQYANNKLGVDVRKEINHYVRDYLSNNNPDEWESFLSKLNSESLYYDRVNGDGAGMKYRNTKLNDMYSRVGNAVLGQCRQRVPAVSPNEATPRRVSKTAPKVTSRRQSTLELPLSIQASLAARQASRGLRRMIQGEWSDEYRQNMAAYYALEDDIER